MVISPTYVVKKMSEGNVVPLPVVTALRQKVMRDDPVLHTDVVAVAVGAAHAALRDVLQVGQVALRCYDVRLQFAACHVAPRM